MAEFSPPPESEHRLEIRRPNSCKFPSKMNDSELDCMVYKTRVLCIQTCMFGYRLSDGIQREMKCNFDEDKWMPTTEFEKCEPFIDCTLTLGPGGRYTCNINYMKKGPICEISCDSFQGNPAVPPLLYQCDIEGKWIPNLPFCATPGSGMKLVSPPKSHEVFKMRYT